MAQRRLLKLCWMRRNRNEVIGRLDRRITIEQCARTLDDARQQIETWSTYATVWANKKDGGGTEPVNAGRETDLSKTIFTIRFDANVTQKMRVVYNTIVYDIEQINEKGRSHLMELITESRE